jgi:dethiobiotin synthetase
LGTGTEVGKTYIGAATLAALRQRGVSVAARKPVQSFDPADPHPTDAAVLAGATGERVDDVCPPHRNLRVALAPPMATAKLGLAPIAIDDLAAEIVGSWPADRSIGWVESAGGVRSPIAEDGDGVVLARRLAPDVVVLVADAELGTLNAIRLCLDALRPLEIPTVVLLNRYDVADDLHGRNLAWLRDRDGVRVVTDADDLARAVVSRARP